MVQVLLTTSGLVSPVVIPDLGNIEYVHPVVDDPLLQPQGNFSVETVRESLEDGDLGAKVIAGEITLSDETGNPITPGSDLLDFVDRTSDQTIGGLKTFTEDVITIDSPNTSANLEMGYFPSVIPNCYGVRTTGTGFYYCIGANALNPQIVFGSPDPGGTAFLDTDAARPLFLNVLNTGTGLGTDGRGEVVIGRAGLEVGSLNAGLAPNLRLTTIEGSDDWNIYTGSPGNFDGWFRISRVDSSDQNDFVITNSGSTRVLNGAAGSPGLGFINASNYGMFLFPTNDALGLATAGFTRLQIASNGVLTVGNTIDYETLIIGNDDAIPNVKFVEDAIDVLEFTDLADVDNVTIPFTAGDLITFDGTNFRPAADGVNNQIGLLQNGCVAEFIDSTGLDFCNTQIGATAGSAFYIAKRALGTIATPLPITDGIKIGGYSFLAFDGVTSNPGYVGAEINSFAQGDQDGANGGANLRFLVTPQGTKTPLLSFIIQDDGILTVGDQADYETQIIGNDNAIPNVKYVNDRLTLAYGAIRVESTGADQATNYNVTTPEIALVLTGTVTNFGAGATYFTNSSGSITCNFDGVVEVTYSVPHFGNPGTRLSLKSVIQLNGSNYGAVEYSYIRNGSNHRRDTNSGAETISVTNGDVIRIGMRRAEDSTTGNPITIEPLTTIIVKRVA